MRPQDRGVLEQTIVFGSPGAPRFNPSLEVRQLHAQDGRLDGGQPVVVALETRAITLLLAPAAQQRGGTRVFRMVGGEHAAFTSSAEVLGGIETEAADITDATGAPPAVLRAMGLRRVFNH